MTHSPRFPRLAARRVSLLLACGLAVLAAASAGRPALAASPQGASPQGASPQGASPQGASPQGASPQGAAPGQIETVSCMFDLPANVREGEDIECGYLTVPEFHARPEGRTIQLAYAILKASPPAGRKAAPDPLFMLQGGPGGSTIDTYAVWLLRDNPFAEERDVVLFDQRGTYYSDPNLVCSESMTLTLQTIEQDLTAEEYARLNERASLACRDRLAGEGVALAAYNSLENAADVEALRQALDYGDINLYGVSYGTLLAQHVMRNHPDHLRSVILDAVVPTDVDFRAEGPRSHDRAFTQLFEACAADPDCAAAFPDLERVFFDLVEALEKAPARVPLTDPETGRTYQAAFDGETLIGAVTQLLYSSEILPALPKMIYDARAGHFDLFSRILPLLIFDRTMSEGMYMTTLCAEDADYTLDQVRTDGIRPQLVEDERRDEADFLQLCAKWGVPVLGPAVDDPVVSELPTLIYSGRFDPVTPPAFGERVAKSLPRSTFITWPAGSHGELLSNACTAGVAAAFLRDPLAAPDTSCVVEHSRAEFVTPAQVVMTRATPNILALLEGRGDPAPVVAYVLGALFLLSLFVVWPLAWVIRILREKPGDRRPGAKAPRWIAVANALLLLAFGIGLPAATLASSLQSQDLVLFFGLPAGWAWLFALSLAAFVLSVAMAFCAGAAWARRYWSAGGRAYYTLLALAAVVCAAALVQLDAAFPLVRRLLGLQ